MKVEFKPLDLATLLGDDESILYLLNDALKEGDAAEFAHAIGIAARAKGMTRVADDTGLAREALYRSFSQDGNPSLKSTLAVLASLGFRLAVQPLREKTEADASEAAE
jgi:probable addiction module antidote protein